MSSNKAMMFLDRGGVPDMTVLELAITIVCTRRTRSGIDEIAAEIARWFGREVRGSHIEMPLHRLLGRSEVAFESDRYAATEMGRARAESAANSLVHLFFRDRYFFDVGKLLEVTLVTEDGHHAP